MRRGLCNLILLGNREKIETLAKQFRVDLSHIRIIDPRETPEIEKYARNFYESRKHKVKNLENLLVLFHVRVTFVFYIHFYIIFLIHLP